MLLAGCHAPLHSWHCFSPPLRPANNRTAHRLPGVAFELAIGQQSCHLARIALREHRWLAQRAIARRLLLAAVLGACAFEVHELAAPGHADALGSCLMRLQLV